MTKREILRRHFDGEDGSFLTLLRCELRWDWDAFRELTGAMFDVANEVRGDASIETWLAEGFWFCDTWIRDWTNDENFPRPDRQAYDEAIELIHDLAHFLFVGESPYQDNTLEKSATHL